MIRVVSRDGDEHISIVIEVPWIVGHDGTMSDAVRAALGHHAAAEYDALLASMEEEQPDNRPKLTRKQCETIAPASHFSRRMLSDNDAPTCPICQQEYKPNRRVVRLPCQHMFCRDCVYKWLCTESSECPICRIGMELFVDTMSS